VNDSGLDWNHALPEVDSFVRQQEVNHVLLEEWGPVAHSRVNECKRLVFASYQLTYYPSLIADTNDRHSVPKIAAQPVPDDGRTGGFWMHHARDRQIHAMGAAIVERVHRAMREESAGSGTKQVFFRHPAAPQQRMPWHGLVGRCGFCFARTRPLAQGKRTRTGFWPGSRGGTY